MNGSSAPNGYHHSFRPTGERENGGQHSQQQPRVHFGGEGMDHHHHHRNNGDDSFYYDGQRRETTLDHVLGIFTAILASICVCGLLTILCILYVTIRPFSKSLYRRLAAQLGASSMLDALALLLPNTRIILSGDSDVPTPVGTSLLVSNHSCDADWWAILMLGRCVGLRGSIKIFMRNEFLHVQTQEDAFHHFYHSSQNNNSSGGSGSPVGSGGGASGVGRSSPITRSPVTGHAMVTPSAAATATTSNSSPPRSGGGGGTTLATTTTAGRPYGSVTGGGAAAGPDLSLTAKLLHLFLDFPLINGTDYVTDRENLFRLLRSFARDERATTHATDRQQSPRDGGNDTSADQDDSNGSGMSSSTASGGQQPPVHLLLFPEAWSVHRTTGTVDRQAILARSNEFAQKESRPQLKHLLLPRTRGFNASLECLRASSPVVYDVTMAYAGYDGSLPPSVKLSLTTIWDILRRKFPREVHLRIRRYSMEEVLQDSSWLDKKWQEKDRLLHHFARHQSFPTDSRGYYGRHRVFDTRSHSMETSVVALLRLLLLPWAVPLLLLLSIPLFCTLFWIWLANNVVRFVLSPWTSNDDDDSSRTRRGRGDHHDGRSDNSQTRDDDDDDAADIGGQNRTPGGSSAPGTPYVPATPFASPSAKYFSGNRKDDSSPT